MSSNSSHSSLSSVSTSTASITTALETLLRKKKMNAKTHTTTTTTTNTTTTPFGPSLTMIPNTDELPLNGCDYNDSWMESYNTDYTLSFCPIEDTQDNEIPEEISLSLSLPLSRSHAGNSDTTSIIPVCYYHETIKQWNK